jgi:hypothetical protein
MYQKKGVNENIFCAQLLGIAEHATGYCRKNVFTYKIGSESSKVCSFWKF